MEIIKPGIDRMLHMLTCIAAPSPGEPIKIQSIAEDSESSGRNSGLGNNSLSFEATPGWQLLLT